MESQLENIHIHYDTRGQGLPLVVLHGYWSDHRQMVGCMEPLFAHRDGWKRIYPDLPGMGKTPGEEWIRNSDQMLDIMSDFVDAVIPGERFVLGGYSYGGYLAQGLLSRKSEWIDGLLLICPVVIPDSEKRSRPPMQILIKDEALMASLGPEEREEFESWVAVQSPRIWQRTRDECNVGGELADELFLTRLLEEGYAYSFDLTEAIEMYTKPVLVLVGRQDWVVGYRDHCETIIKFPRATIAVLDRAGHNLPITQEGIFSALVGEWLDRVEESI